MNSKQDKRYLSIGQVVNLLRGAYPELSNSKIRFLEDEGLLSPHRTEKGYRQYSRDDVDRLEIILHLQKTSYLPLNVIKEKLDSATSVAQLAFEVGLIDSDPSKIDDVSDDKDYYRLEEIPDVLGVELSFVRQLVDCDLISLVKTPHARELVNRGDFNIIRSCAELRRFGIEPRNLRQYVSAANRESVMFEQVLLTMLGHDSDEEDRDAKLNAAFDTLHGLTSSVQKELLKRTVFSSFKSQSDK